MDMVTVIGVSTVALSAGFGFGLYVRGGAVKHLRQMVNDKDAALTSQNNLLKEANHELRNLGQVNSELRTAYRDLERKLGRSDAEINRLKPFADLGQQVKRQRERALERAMESNRSRYAQRAATEIDSKVDAKPARKRA